MDLSGNKRQLETDSALVVSKKQKITDDDDDNTAGKEIMERPRTSSLMSPIMELSGHGAEVYTVKFSPDGQHLASAGFDRDIFCWNVFGECENFLLLKGHTNAVLDLHWSDDGSKLYTASADKTAAIWDIESSRKIKKATEHTRPVNSNALSQSEGTDLMLTGSDDGLSKLWDIRKKKSLYTFDIGLPVTSCSFSKNDEQVFIGGLNNIIQTFDLRKQNEPIYELTGHTESITDICLSPDGSYLLSNAMDNTLRIWDVRPFVTKPDRCVKVFGGHQHTFEQMLLKCSWSPDGSKIASGSSDRFVYVWATGSRKILYKLPGHVGSVNEVAFHPSEPIIASSSSDKKIYLGEIQE